MTLDGCAPCNCIPSMIGNDKFKQDVETILCAILEAILGGGGGGENVNVASWGGVATSLGQKTMAASVPVVIASDQSSFNVAVTSVIPGTGATNLGKAEDSPHTSGDTGVAIWGVRNDSAASFTSANFDYSPLSIGASGELQVELDYRFQQSTAFGIMKPEDSPSNNADIGVMILAKQETTPTNDVSASGDYQCFKTNVVGALYHESANQVGTYAASITAGAGGGVTTTGASVLTNSAKAKIITVLNTTDVLILISPDAGTTYPYFVSANGGATVIDLGANGRWAASNIFAKSVTSNSSSGSLYVGLTI